MDLNWLNQIINQQIQNLKEAPEEMLKAYMVDETEYRSLTDRNAFAIFQLEHLQVTIKEFIKSANNL